MNHNEVWIQHPDEIWVLGSIVKEDADETVIIQPKNLKPGSGQIKLPRKDLLFVNPSSADDMTSLHYLHEPALLANLKDRYTNDFIYTYMGAALIAINPYKKVSEPMMQDYMSSKPGMLPHPFTISENCFKNLTVLKKNQSIVISGESGAGKTETAKIVIKYLAERNRLSASPASKNENSSKLYEKLIQMSPILESFGNAKTSRNANSSRFGKFMKLLYSNGISPPAPPGGKPIKPPLTLIGAAIETYLLEKSRVVYQNEGEQNFHIFYSLLEALPPSSNINPKLQFKIARKAIGQSSGVLDPTHSLSSVTEAFATLGITNDEIQNIWKILAALLYLGNIIFETFDSPEGPVAKISASQDPTNSGITSMQYLKLAADLLSVDPTALQNTFLQREMETRGEKFKVPLSVREATFARDASIKAIYEALFNYIVKLINRSLLVTAGSSGPSPSSQSPDEKFIGVLDIFGFESFEKNGFEQLLINYANEALQNTFNKQIFDKELQLFEEEKIEVTIGECPNNLKCVELISSKNESVFNTLDTISRQPQPSDERFCEELHKQFTKKSNYWGSVHRKDMKNLFVINHYATTVKYTVGNAPAPSGKGAAIEDVNASNDNAWIAKNNDAIPDGLEVLYQQSSLLEFRSLSVELQNVKDQPKRRKSVMMKPTIVATFSKSMQELNDLLESTTCHFIRCIKPNPLAKPNTFHLNYVVEQVRALGILQACEILSISLPTRISYQELKNALANTVNKLCSKFPMLNNAEGNVLLIATILKAFQIPDDSYRLGVTIAFFRPGQLASIDRLLNAASSPDTEQVIVKNIESAIEQYNTIINDISRISNQISLAVEFVNELEIRQERLRTQFTYIQAAHQNGGLDIPEDISKLLGDIENKYLSQQSKRKEIFKQKSKLDSILLIKSFAKGKTKKLDGLLERVEHQYMDLINELEDSYSKKCNEKYDAIHQTIEQLEELNNRPIDSKIVSLIEENDTKYETIMDRVTNVEELINEVKLNAQRCKIDEAYAKYSIINESIIEVNTITQELSQAIDRADQGLQAHEASRNEINFSGLEMKIQEMFDFFNVLNTFISKINESYTSLFNEVQAFEIVEEKPAAPISQNKPPPPPPPPGSRPAPPATTSSPVSTAPAPASAQAAPQPPEKPVKRTSVAYTLKDLAALKKRGSTAATAEDAAKIAKESENATTNSTSSSTQDSSLPSEWKELFDPKTQRPYYVHRITKHRQWQRPTTGNSNANDDASSVHSSNTNESSTNLRKERVKSVRIQQSGQLPPNWREVMDKKSGRAYYVNDVTKERQWRRPENIIATTDASPNKIETVDRVSRRMSRKISGLTLEDLQNHNHNHHNQSNPIEPPASPAQATPSKSTKGNKTSNNLVEERIQQSRRTSALIISEELTSNDNLSDTMKQTISYLIRVGYQIKTGYLQKQSKLLGRWRKRYFVLNEQRIMYFDSEKEYQQALKNFKNSPNLSLKSEKQFLLSSKTQVSYTTTENCFSLLNPSDGSGSGNNDEEETWYLLADDENDMEEWMKAINGHIHVTYLQENKLTGKDYWDQGQVALSLWKVPAPNSASTARRPVGIRSVPHVDGPRTGEGLFPGDVIEVVQTIEDKETNQKYLRLADDRGWVFENHPVANYAILTPAGGKLVESLKTFEYSHDFMEPLPIYSNPRCLEESATDYSFPPGSKFQICAEWTISSEIVNGPTADEGDEVILFSYLKLRDGRGWVEMYHNVTGGRLLVPVE